MRRWLLIFLAVLVGGCATTPIPTHPGVLVVAPSEATSDLLHGTCAFVASRNSGTVRGAQSLAGMLGANVVMPLGGVSDRESSTSSSYRSVQTGNTVTTYVSTTRSSSSSEDTFYAMFRCASLPPIASR